MAPSSTAIPAPQDWADESLLIPHEGLRLIMSRVTAALRAAEKKENKVENLKAFFKFFKKYFLPIVHEHHDNEEELFFPWLAKRAPLEKKLSADHKTLISKMDEIDSIGDEFLKQPNVDATKANEVFSSAKEKFEALEKLMCEHLAEEETQVPTLLRTHYTEKETDELVLQIVKKGGLKGNKMFVPVIFESMKMWKGPESAKEFKKKLPFPLRVLWWLDWDPSYERNHKGLIRAIEGQ